ncbi:MAG: selenium cofactor biosynthesis protein YqeC [Pseudomonadota bacterium]
MQQEVRCFKVFENVTEAIDIRPRDRCIAIIGAGGKTSLMYAMSKALVKIGRTVICTTTTKIFPPSFHQSPKVIFLGDELPQFTDVRPEISVCRHLTIGSRIDPYSGKVLGVSADQIHFLTEMADHVIIEADGASGRPIKAPAAYEPVIPASASLVIPVIGLDALFMPANSPNVFRLENFLIVTKSFPETIITPHEIGLLSKHPEGLLRNVPGSSTVSVFLNKIDKTQDPKFVFETATHILQNNGERIRSVVAGTLSLHGRLFTRFEML